LILEKSAKTILRPGLKLHGFKISVRPDAGTLVMLHDMPTSPMAKVGRSAAAEVMSRRVFFDMWIRLR
jgi:hypothetical protein